jgi:hypothetical protein
VHLAPFHARSFGGVAGVGAITHQVPMRGKACATSHINRIDLALAYKSPDVNSYLADSLILSRVIKSEPIS